jgi:hypothetical protein
MHPIAGGTIMDVDSLKTELEKHLANNPDEHAPHGFRDRFDTVVEQYQAEGGTVSKSALEAELLQIRVEAEAAANAAASPGAEAAPPRVEPPVRPVPPGEPAGAPGNDSVDPPASGLVQRYGLALVVAVIVLAAAYYFFRR